MQLMRAQPRDNHASGMLIGLAEVGPCQSRFARAAAHKKRPLGRAGVRVRVRCWGEMREGAKEERNERKDTMRWEVGRTRIIAVVVFI